MNYKEAGFREFYHHFVAVPLKANLLPLIKDYPWIEQADHILTYGYMDQECGMTLAVLGMAKETEDGFLVIDGNDNVHSIIRISTVAEDEVTIITEDDEALKKKYATKIEMLRGYDASEDVEITREMDFLDPFRHEIYVDDVQVLLQKDGMRSEGCWVRITGIGENCVVGTLLNEPYRDFGCHKGDTISVFAEETADGNVICYSNVETSPKVTREDLMDGRMLEDAVAEFKKKCDEESLLGLVEILRDSYVWIPCQLTWSEYDQKKLVEIAQRIGEDPDAITSRELTEYYDSRLMPHIIKSGDHYQLPIFSTEEAMGEFGTRFSKIQKHILDVISLARNNEKKPSKIVLNVFTDPFVIDSEYWVLIEKMKSRIEGE